MRTRALFFIGTLSGVFYFPACGSDNGDQVRDAAPLEKKDAAPSFLDAADVPVQQPDGVSPDAPVAPDAPQPPDAPTAEVGRLDTAPTETGLVDSEPDGTQVRLDGDRLDVNTADKPPQVDSAVAEAGLSEVEPPAVLFSSSPCKKSAEASMTTAPGASLKVIDNQVGLDGLECVAWQRGSKDLELDLFNFDGACGANWTGNGVVGDGGVSLAIDNPSCMVASCGICMYDWSFTLASPIPTNQSVPVSIQVSACPGSSTSTTTATIGVEKSGIHCTFAHYGALAWHASAKGLCGKAGMPCVGSSLCGSGSPSSAGTCDIGLLCDSSAAANEPRCLVPCQEDTDCPRTDVWSCTSGLCRPKAD